MYHRGDAQRPHTGGDHHGSERHAAIWSGEGVVVEKLKIIEMTVQSMKAIIQVEVRHVTMHVEIISDVLMVVQRLVPARQTVLISVEVPQVQNIDKVVRADFVALSAHWPRCQCAGGDAEGVPIIQTVRCGSPGAVHQQLCRRLCVHAEADAYTSAETANLPVLMQRQVPTIQNSLIEWRTSPLCCNDRRKYRQCSSFTESLTSRVAEAGSHDSKTRKIV